MIHAEIAVSNNETITVTIFFFKFDCMAKFKRQLLHLPRV